MLNTLSFDMKTLNNWDFPQKLYSSSILSAEYSENSGILSTIFPKNWEIRHFVCTILTNLIHLLGKTPNNQDFPQP